MSWIDRFVEATARYESPELFRRWTAISVLGSVLEQKVALPTAPLMYANLYIFLVSPPGGGKSRAMGAARDILTQLPDFFIAPTSINAASMIDALKECKRAVVTAEGSYEYNTMSIMVGEFGTFMSQYDDDLMALLTDFFNVTPYSQRRRTSGLKLFIPRPQLSMLVGCTPATLMKFMPEVAWGQGFASRILFVFSADKPLVDDFASTVPLDTADLVHDLKMINNLIGTFAVSPEYSTAINQWRSLDENHPPKPTHPRLTHYCARRKEILYRLSMISAVDRSDALILTREDFNRAMGWMLDAEQYMPLAFDTNLAGSDSTIMDEILHFVESKVKVDEGALVRYVSRRAQSHAVARIIDLMVMSGMLVVINRSRFGIRTFSSPKLVAGAPSAPPLP